MKWKKGEKTKISVLAGCHPNAASAYIRGTKMPNKDVSSRLERASAKVLGKENRIPVAAWMQQAEHPLMPSLESRKEARDVARSRSKIANAKQRAAKKAAKEAARKPVVDKIIERATERAAKAEAAKEVPKETPTETPSGDCAGKDVRKQLEKRLKKRKVSEQAASKSIEAFRATKKEKKAAKKTDSAIQYLLSDPANEVSVDVSQAVPEQEEVSVKLEIPPLPEKKEVASPPSEPKEEATPTEEVISFTPEKVEEEVKEAAPPVEKQEVVFEPPVETPPRKRPNFAPRRASDYHRPAHYDQDKVQQPARPVFSRRKAAAAAPKPESNNPPPMPAPLTDGNYTERKRAKALGISVAELRAMNEKPSAPQTRPERQPEAVIIEKPTPEPRQTTTATTATTAQVIQKPQPAPTSTYIDIERECYRPPYRPNTIVFKST